MNHRLFVALLGTVTLASAASAQDAERPPIDLFQVIRDTPWTVAVSARQFSSNATTSFSGIGSVASPFNSGPAAGGAITRDYVDGSVDVDATGNRDGVSRSWAFARNTQRVTLPNGGGPGVEFHNFYGTAPAGFAVSADSDTSMGVDLAVTRRIRRLSRRWELGLTLGMGLTDVNMKDRQTVDVALGRLTDTYSLGGRMLPDPSLQEGYSAPSSGSIIVQNPDGTSSTVTFDTTVPINSTPFSRDDNPAFGAAVLQGFWQVKGAYYFLRIGPTLRVRLTEKLQLAVGAGAAAGFLGTKFRYDEALETTATTATIRERSETTKDEFLPGYYGEAQVEYYLSQKTGFFAGASYESLGDFNQTIGGRRATIELGKGVGIKLGIVTRF